MELRAVESLVRKCIRLRKSSSRAVYSARLSDMFVCSVGSLARAHSGDSGATMHKTDGLVILVSTLLTKTTRGRGLTAMTIPITPVLIITDAILSQPIAQGQRKW